MGNNNLQRKYSLRKFKGIGLASAVIGLFFANQSVYANVTADGKDETTIVKEFDKVSSSAKTIFTDNQNPTKKVTVDAVADIRYKQPTKANYNTGDVDGTDSIKYHSEATVNYLLESDNSKLQDSKTVSPSLRVTFSLVNSFAVACPFFHASTASTSLLIFVATTNFP